MKAPHIDIAMIERADHFEATIFLGTGRYHTASFDLLADAREAARQFTTTANNGRRGMVYAVTPEGRSTLVPDTYQPANGAPIMTTATALSGTDVSKLTAILTGGGFKRANSKEAAIKRFAAVAAEHGMGEPAVGFTLKQDTFEAAQNYVLACQREERAISDEGHKAIAAASKTVAERIVARRAARKSATPPKGPIMANGREIVRDANGFGVPGPAQAKAPAGKRAEVLAAAERGIVPEAPDFSAETHKRFRPKLEQVKAMIAAKDIAGLKALAINPVSSSPKAIDKYRNLAVVALEAQAAS